MANDSDDDRAAAFYDDAENREFAGAGHRRSRATGNLTEHVPIRFRAETIRQVQSLADEDGKTVSSWIRGVVEREVRRRLPNTNGTEIEILGDFQIIRMTPTHLSETTIAAPASRRQVGSDA